MKKLHHVLCLFILIWSVQLTNAQNTKEYIKLKARMWDDPDFKATTIPEKWKNESAVILAKSFEYEVRKEILISSVDENKYFHKRIKILDKSAINEFSELSFENDVKFNTWFGGQVMDVSIGVKVIKPSGKENIIDMKDAVVNEIKEGMNKKAYKKIAIPDLEIGDIVDYFYVTKNTYQNMTIMDPEFYLLVDEYPIVKQKFNVHVMRLMYFNSRSINGAPQLKQTDKEDETSFSFTDSDREKIKEALWAYPFRIYPTLKFQAFYIPDMMMSNLDFLTFFLKEKRTNNSSVDLAHIDDYVKKLYRTNYLFNTFLISDTRYYLRKTFGKDCPPDTIVKYAYYYMRQKVGALSVNSLMLNLSEVLDKNDIKHDLVLTIPNYISDISDLILPQELNYLIRVKGSPDYFIGDYSVLSTFKSISKEFQGNNAYAVNNPNQVSNPKVEKIVIPVDKPEVNSEFASLNINMAPGGMDSLIINMEKTISGIGRKEEIFFVVDETQYEDEVKYFLDKKEKEKDKDKKKSKRQLKKEKERRQIGEQEQQDGAEALKNYLKNDFDAGVDFKIDSCALKNIGIWDNSPLMYTVNFKLGNMLKKVGPNYIVSMGKLITNQLQLSKTDMERAFDVYAPYTRTFEYKINFEIPAGYKVKGIEKLNMSVVNQTGGFVSKAEMTNNNLVVSVKKYYAHNYEKVTEWPKMLEFIEAAYNFTQQNVLLEKSN